MTEKQVEEKLVKTVDKQGGKALKFLPFLFAGFPDRIVFMPGARIWFVELKKPGGTLSKIQKIRRDWLIGLGFNYRLIDSETTLLMFSKEIAL